MSMNIIAAAPSANITRIADVALSVAGLTLNSGTFGAGYKALQVFVSTPSAMAAGTTIYFTVNSYIAGNYWGNRLNVQSAGTGTTRIGGATNLSFSAMVNANIVSIIGTMLNPSATTPKSFEVALITDANTDANSFAQKIYGMQTAMAAEITSIQFVADNNFPIGTRITVYGMN